MQSQTTTLERLVHNLFVKKLVAEKFLTERTT